MFDMELERQRRSAVEEEEDGGPPRSRSAFQGRSTGPAFATQSPPPWDPLSGQPLPWAGVVRDPLADEVQDPRPQADPLLDGGRLPAAPSPILAAVPSAQLGAHAGGAHEPTDAPPLPERERPRPGAHPGQADDVPPLPERERQEAAQAEDGAADGPPELEQAAPGEGSAAAGPDDGGNSAHEPRATPSPAEREHQLGTALPRAMGEMERAFGEDLSGVGVSDQLPHEAAQAGARAVAGEDQIAFDPASLGFDRPEGKQRLAHEVAHVLQKRKRRAPGGQGSGRDGGPAAPEHDESQRESLEREAEQAGAQMVQGAPARVAAGAQPPEQQFSGLLGLVQAAGRGVRAAAEMRKVGSAVSRLGPAPSRGVARTPRPDAPGADGHAAGARRGQGRRPAPWHGAKEVGRGVDAFIRRAGKTLGAQGGSARHLVPELAHMLRDRAVSQGDRGQVLNRLVQKNPRLARSLLSQAGLPGPGVGGGPGVDLGDSQLVSRTLGAAYAGDTKRLRYGQMGAAGLRRLVEAPGRPDPRALLDDPMAAAFRRPANDPAGLGLLMTMSGSRALRQDGADTLLRGAMQASAGSQQERLGLAHGAAAAVNGEPELVRGLFDRYASAGLRAAGPDPASDAFGDRLAERHNPLLRYSKDEEHWPASFERFMQIERQNDKRTQRFDREYRGPDPDWFRDRLQDQNEDRLTGLNKFDSDEDRDKVLAQVGRAPLYSHVVPDRIRGQEALKIEYDQFSAMNKQDAPKPLLGSLIGEDVDHKGDWEGGSVHVDPRSGRLLQISSSVHKNQGDSTFDMSRTQSVEALGLEGDGVVMELRGPNYARYPSPGNIADGEKQGERGESEQYRDNAVRLQLTPGGGMHPVFNVEKGGHAWWMTERGRENAVDAAVPCLHPLGIGLGCEGDPIGQANSHLGDGSAIRHPLVPLGEPGREALDVLTQAPDGIEGPAAPSRSDFEWHRSPEELRRRR